MGLLNWFEGEDLSGKDQLKNWEELGRFETSAAAPKKEIQYDHESWLKEKEAEKARRENLTGFERRKDLRRRNFGIPEQGSRNGWWGRKGHPIDSVRRRHQNGTPPLCKMYVEELVEATQGNYFLCGILSRTPKRSTRLIGGRKPKGDNEEFFCKDDLAILRERQSRPRLRNEPAPMNFRDRQSQYIGPKLAYASLGGDEHELVLAH